MSFTPLPDPFEVITPLGLAVCKFTYEVGDEFFWICFQKSTCECWWWRNNEIRLKPSISDGFYHATEIKLSPKAKLALEPHLKRHMDKPDG